MESNDGESLFSEFDTAIRPIIKKPSLDTYDKWLEMIQEIIELSPGERSVLHARAEALLVTLVSKWHLPELDEHLVRFAEMLDVNWGDLPGHDKSTANLDRATHEPGAASVNLNSALLMFLDNASIGMFGVNLQGRQSSLRWQSQLLGDAYVVHKKLKASELKRVPTDDWLMELFELVVRYSNTQAFIADETGWAVVRANLPVYAHLRGMYEDAIERHRSGKPIKKQKALTEIEGLVRLIEPLT